MYPYVLFDLDGTLTDPGMGITNSVIYALKKFQIEIPDRTKLYKFIGPPLQTSFREFFGFGEEQCAQAIAYYREYFSETGIFENEVYAGIPELLQKLKANGHTLIVATSKPEEFTNRILEHFDLAKYFDFVAGATMDSTRSAKADVIRHALAQMHLTNRNDIVMVGDRKHDIIGAKENGIDSIGVLYGYGSRDELTQAGATYLAQTPDAIPGIVTP